MYGFTCEFWATHVLVFTHVVFHIKIRELTGQPIYIIAARATTGCQGAPKCHPFHFLQDTPRRFKMDVTVAKLRFFTVELFAEKKMRLPGMLSQWSMVEKSRNIYRSLSHVVTQKLFRYKTHGWSTVDVSIHWLAVSLMLQQTQQFLPTMTGHSLCQPFLEILGI